MMIKIFKINKYKNKILIKIKINKMNKYNKINYRMIKIKKVNNKKSLLVFQINI